MLLLLRSMHRRATASSRKCPPATQVDTEVLKKKKFLLVAIEIICMLHVRQIQGKQVTMHKSDLARIKWLTVCLSLLVLNLTR